jgi:hypothetical protein
MSTRHDAELSLRRDICAVPDPENALNKVSTMNKLMDYMSLSKPAVAYDLTEHRVTAGQQPFYAS